MKKRPKANAYGLETVQEKNRKLKVFLLSFSRLFPKPQSLVKQSRILDTRKQIVSFS
mgnify:CR=1 FL=1